MKYISISLLTLFAGTLICFSAFASTGQSNHNPLSSGFVISPDSVQTSCCWYGTSNNVSKEGVINVRVIASLSSKNDWMILGMTNALIPGFSLMAPLF